MRERQSKHIINVAIANRAIEECKAVVTAKSRRVELLTLPRRTHGHIMSRGTIFFFFFFWKNEIMNIFYAMG